MRGSGKPHSTGTHPPTHPDSHLPASVPAWTDPAAARWQPGQAASPTGASRCCPCHPPGSQSLHGQHRGRIVSEGRDAMGGRATAPVAPAPQPAKTLPQGLPLMPISGLKRQRVVQKKAGAAGLAHCRQAGAGQVGSSAAAWLAGGVGAGARAIHAEFRTALASAVLPGPHT